MLQQVRFVSSDDPSALLFDGLRGILPNLEILSLDPTHLAMVYEYATWRRKTDGSKLLRRIMAKFARHNPILSAATWGPPYDGVRDVRLTRAEELSRSKVSPGSMPLARARMVVESIDDDVPWYTRIDFIDSIAALTSLYSEEVEKKSQDAGVL